MNRKKLLLSIGLAAAVIAAAFFVYWLVARRPAENIMLKTEQTQPVSFRHPLTGEPLTQELRFFPIAVMIDNAYEVTSVFGLDQAEIVYEAPVEGGRTRFMAIYDSTQAIEIVGPIRSLRSYFVDWAEDLGGAVMHVGGSPGALSKIAKTALTNIEQIGGDEIYFYRDDKYDAPSNVFSSSSMWQKAAERKKISNVDVTSWNFQEVDAPAEAGSQQLTLTYSPDNEVAWVYNLEKNNYLRFNNKERFLTPLGDQIASSNIIVIEVKLTDVDAIGRLSLETIGSGDAMVLTAGTKKDVTWIKNSETSRLTFLDKDTQQEAVLNAGTTWVEVVTNLDDVEFLKKE